jgi:hypothetical protein
MTSAVALQQRRPDVQNGLSAPALSWGSSALSKVVEKRISDLQKLTAGSVSTIAKTTETQQSGTIQNQLCGKLAAMKQTLTAVSMYFDPLWRSELIERLDRIHDAGDWEGDDRELPSERSFATFLRTIIYLHPTKRPGIGLSAQGHFLASWRRGTDRIVIEFLPNDELKWVLSQTIDGDRESGAGINQIHRLPDLIAGYEPDRFFNNGEKLLS